jgi:translation initiation factor 2 alpha subunit (eIF-2alpha)
MKRTPVGHLDRVSEPGREPVFEIVRVSDRRGRVGWSCGRVQSGRVIRRFDDYQTARLVMQAMEAVEKQPPNGGAR